MSDKPKRAAQALIEGLTSFNDKLKALYPRPGEPMSDEGRAILDRMEAERVARNKDIAGLIDEQGRPTGEGRERLRGLAAGVVKVLAGHDDNTGASCRIDLDGHDCCATCNAAEDILRVTAKYYEGDE